MQKRVVAVHDISCVGKCSLTVALPILSAAGMECSVLPTAILSTHTGGFFEYTNRDLTADLLPILRHWQSIGLRMDAVYTGYLATPEQLDVMETMLDSFAGEDTFVLVDPVMGDHGELYPELTPEFAGGMARLCRRADLIVPNLTEASLLLSRPYQQAYTREQVEEMLLALAELGPKMVVISGIPRPEGQVAVAAYARETGAFSWYETPEIAGYYPGTGDVFGSALLAALLREKSLNAAICLAADYTLGSIIRTRDAGTDVRFGVDFEHGIPTFLRLLEEAES